MSALNYHFKPEEGQEEVEDCQQTFYVSQTVDQAVNTSGVLHFSIPADPDAFTDTTATYMCVKFRVLRVDGTKLSKDDTVFLPPPGLLSFFRTCSVAVNGTALAPTELYPFSAVLANTLGTSQVAKDNFWDALGAWELFFVNSTLAPGDGESFNEGKVLIAESREAVFYGRVYQDFLMSCAQLLPPGIKLDITLTRSSDAFILCQAPSGAAEEGPAQQFKLEIDSVTMFVKRMELGPRTLALCRESLREGGRLRYNRLSCDVQQVPSGTLAFRWNNVYQGGPLPHTLYVVLVKQKGFYGDLGTLPTYFEALPLRSFRVLNNGRDVLPAPYVFDLHKHSDAEGSLDLEKSDASAAFLGLGKVLGLFANKTASCISRDSFMAGNTILAAQINTCGGRRVQPGALDIEIQFTPAPDASPDHRLICLCFGEFDRVLNLSSNLTIF